MSQVWFKFLSLNFHILLIFFCHDLIALFLQLEFVLLQLDTHYADHVTALGVQDQLLMCNPICYILELN